MHHNSFLTWKHCALSLLNQFGEICFTDLKIPTITVHLQYIKTYFCLIAAVLAHFLLLATFCHILNEIKVSALVLPIFRSFKET